MKYNFTEAEGDAIAYFAGGPSGIGPKYYAECLAWLMGKRPDLNEMQAKRAVTLAAHALDMHCVKGFKLPYKISYACHVSPGDTICGSRTYYDELGLVNGVVKEIAGDIVYTEDDNWCSVESIYAVIWKESWKNEPATQKQLDLLREIKEDHDDDDELFVGPSLTKGQASMLIDKWPKPGQVQCWECGCYFFPKDGAVDFSGQWYCGC